MPQDIPSPTPTPASAECRIPESGLGTCLLQALHAALTSIKICRAAIVVYIAFLNGVGQCSVPGSCWPSKHKSVYTRNGRQSASSAWSPRKGGTTVTFTFTLESISFATVFGSLVLLKECHLLAFSFLGRGGEVTQSSQQLPLLLG